MGDVGRDDRLFCKEKWRHSAKKRSYIYYVGHHELFYWLFLTTFVIDKLLLIEAILLPLLLRLSLAVGHGSSCYVL